MIVALTPYLLRERRLAQRVDRERARRDHVVRQAERVADLVRDHLAHRLAHQLFGNVERARRRVGRAGLEQQPVAVRRACGCGTR